MEQENLLTSLLRQCAREVGVALLPAQEKQFILYLKQLKIWSASVNLTGIRDDQAIIVKHFVDSLACLSVETMKKGARIVDIGTGAGFPGIPLKIVRSDLQLTLVEPVKKKASFLLSIVGLLRLDHVSVFCGTLTEFIVRSQSCRDFDYVITRALRPDELLEQGDLLLEEKEGRMILYSSRPFDQAVYPAWSLIAEREFDLPMKFGHRVITILRRS